MVVRAVVADRMEGMEQDGVGSIMGSKLGMMRTVVGDKRVEVEWDDAVSLLGSKVTA